jgi:hypothetical protein
MQTRKEVKIRVLPNGVRLVTRPDGRTHPMPPLLAPVVREQGKK